jgi:hypothetical protein
MAVLPYESPRALFFTKCPAHSGGVARKPERDLRENTEGYQKAESRPRSFDWLQCLVVAIRPLRVEELAEGPRI